MEKDRFGNSIVRDTSRIREALNNTSLDKAIVLYDVDEATLGREVYDDAARGREQYVGCTAAGSRVYVIRNQSNCPRLFDGKVLAAGVAVLVPDLSTGNYSAVFVKDKTKPVCTNLGGIHNSKDEAPADAAIREAREETQGTMRDSGSRLEGLSLRRDQLTHIATVKFNSSYYGIDNIDDTYQLYAASVRTDESAFLRLLYEQSTIYYDVTHDETECVSLIPLFPELLNDVDAVLAAKPAGLSALHWVLAHASLARELHKPFALKEDNSFHRVRSVTLH